MNLKQLVKEALENRDCCTATKPTKAPILNESIAPREILSEGLKYHIDNNKPLTEHVYRAGSTAYFHLWAEARALYTRGILDFSGDDLAILTETHLGEFGIYEGKKVPLDFIMEEVELEENNDVEKIKSLCHSKIKQEAEKNRKPFPSVETNKQYVDCVKNSTEKKPNLEENDKKTPALGKPKRGGSKKFYVYVKDPKTKRIKKVSFGAQGMSAKINNSKARAAFSKRHNCPQKNDRTKASYWSCRLPRYAKLLGLKSNFSGFW